MVDFLLEILDQRRYDDALTIAEQLLNRDDNTDLDLLKIYYALLMCRNFRGEYEAAVNAGKVAWELAYSLGQWDEFGSISVDLGAVYYRFGKYDQSLYYLLNYLARLHCYREALRHETLVWYNLGRTYMMLGEREQASKALRNALHAADRLGDEREAHGIRQALIDAYMQTGDLERIPQLFAKCSHYLRCHPSATEVKSSYLWSLQLRTSLRLRMGNLRKARIIALKGLRESEGRPRHQFVFHMLLADIAKKEGRLSEATGHALAARSYALRLHRNDLESEASEFIYDITTLAPAAMMEVTEYFLRA